MTREQLIEKVCLSSEIQNDECVDCAYCMEVLNEYLDKYDKQIRAGIFNEIMPILIDIVDKEDCCYGYEQEIDRLECEWRQLKERK